MTATQIIILTLLFWYISTSFATNFITEGISKPIGAGVVIGLIMGDLPAGIAISVGINLIYMGVTTFGGVISIDEQFASYISIPIAIASGLTPEQAVTLALPFGVLGGLVSTLWKTINGSITRIADKHCANANIAGLRRCAFLYPALVIFVLKVIPFIAIMIVGPAAVGAVAQSIPAWLNDCIQVMGTILPALGFASFIRVMGKRELIPIFIAGFYTMQFFKLPIIGCAIFGAILGYLWIQFKMTDKAQA